MAGSTLASAQDLELTAMRTILVPLRGQPLAHPEVRGATAQFTPIKHQLRDWIESRFDEFPERGAEAVLARELNATLQKLELTCSTNRNAPGEYCPIESLVGYLGPVRLSRQQEVLLVETAVGIACGYDESAYLYRWNGQQWNRVWSSEQLVYTEKQYTPQMFHAVKVSAGRPGQKNHLVLTLGSNPHCTSNWQPVFYRLWRIAEKEQAAVPLFDKSEMAFLGKDEPPIVGTVRTQDVTVEFSTTSLDPATNNRNAVRRFNVMGAKPRRVAPIAMTPRNFVEEWITQPWSESSRWSSSQALLKWHKRFFTGSAEFTAASNRCQDNGDLWQVSLRSTSIKEQPAKEKDSPIYFLVRWRKPYLFTLMDVQERAWPKCTAPSTDEYRTLLKHHR